MNGFWRKRRAGFDRSRECSTVHRIDAFIGREYFLEDFYFLSCRFCNSEIPLFHKTLFQY